MWRNQILRKTTSVCFFVTAIAETAKPFLSVRAVGWIAKKDLFLLWSELVGVDSRIDQWVEVLDQHWCISKASAIRPITTQAIYEYSGCQVSICTKCSSGTNWRSRVHLTKSRTAGMLRILATITLRALQAVRFDGWIVYMIILQSDASPVCDGVCECTI